MPRRFAVCHNKRATSLIAQHTDTRAHFPGLSANQVTELNSAHVCSPVNSPARLSACLLACLSVCPPACLSVYLPICLPACLPASLSACLPPYLPACLPICLPGSLSASPRVVRWAAARRGLHPRSTAEWRRCGAAPRELRGSCCWLTWQHCGAQRRGAGCPHRQTRGRESPSLSALQPAGRRTERQRQRGGSHLRGSPCLCDD